MCECRASKAELNLAKTLHTCLVLLLVFNYIVFLNNDYPVLGYFFSVSNLISYYYFQVINETLPYVLCVPAFVPSTSLPTDNLWVLGGAFLSQYYSIYDIAKKNIGFVRAA